MHTRLSLPGLAVASPRLRGLATALCLASLAVLPASAAAKTYQGTISTPTVSADGRTVTAQITVSASCTQGEYCGFFPQVSTVSDSQQCADTITGSDWIGSLMSSAIDPNAATTATATATWSEWPSLYSGGKRACLYAEPGATLVAQTTYQVPAPPPAPTYTPPAYPPPVAAAPTAAPPVTAQSVPQHLGYAEAVGVTRAWMKKKYGTRWTRGRSRTTRCPTRSSPAQIGCYAVWRYRGKPYSKSIVITEEEERYTISRDFSSALPQVTPAPSSPPPSSTPAPAPPDASGDFCATHVCIPNFPNGTGSVVQCSDGTYSHSGGIQGACSHHGGVSGVRIARTARRRSAEVVLRLALRSAHSSLLVTTRHAYGAAHGTGATRS